MGRVQESHAEMYLGRRLSWGDAPLPLFSFLIQVIVSVALIGNYLYCF